MMFASVFSSLTLGGQVLLSVVLLSMALVGFFLQHRLLQARAPIFWSLLPTVLSALLLLLLFSVSLGWIYLSPLIRQGLVVSGLTRLWGTCCEGFLIGCAAAWLVRLFDRNIKHK